MDEGNNVSDVLGFSLKKCIFASLHPVCQVKNNAQQTILTITSMKHFSVREPG